MCSSDLDTETVVPGDMFSSMRGTLQSARHGVSNDPAQPAPANPRDWNPAAVVSTRRILEMATLGGAAPCGLEGEVGSLSPGKAADIVLLRASHLNYFPINDGIGAVVVAADTGSVEAVFVVAPEVDGGLPKVEEALALVDVADQRLGSLLVRADALAEGTEVVVVAAGHADVGLEVLGELEQRLEGVFVHHVAVAVGREDELGQLAHGLTLVGLDDFLPCLA